ncbi:MAG: PEP-CTERM sorting domain-containing protein [Rhodanobacter sp.]
MKHFYSIMPFALVALAFGVASPSAFAAKGFTGAVVDATPCEDGGNVCSINNLPPPAPSVAFTDCSKIHDTQLTTLGSGFNYCVWLNNNTGANLTTFNFVIPFAAGTVSDGDTLSCLPFSSESNGMTVALTPTSGCSHGLSSTDTFFDLTFTASPYVGQQGTFILAMNLDNAAFRSDSPFGPTGVTVGVPEPGELGLFGLGLLGIGVGYGWKKRRESRRNGYAA